MSAPNPSGDRARAEGTSTAVAASEKYWVDKADGGHRHISEDWLSRYADELLPLLGSRGGILVDVGCGACELTTYLAPAFERVHAVDFSEAMLLAAMERINRGSVQNVDLHSGTMQALPPQVRSADVVFSYGVVQYLTVADLREHLAECRRVLAPNGLVCVANIPDLRRRGWYCQNVMSPAPGGRLGRVKQWFAIARMRLGGLIRRDFLWDGIGSWFSHEEIAAAARSAGFDAEFTDSLHYGYRFHAVLRIAGKLSA